MVPFLVYAGIALVAFSFISSSSLPGLAAGVIAGGALYIGIAVIMVKFGWNPPTFGRPSNTQADAAGPIAVEGGARRRPEEQAGRHQPHQRGNLRAPKRH